MTSVKELRGNIYDIDVNPTSYVERVAKYHPGKLALVYEQEDWTYGAFAARVRRFAHYLASHGVTAGDRVAYLGLNSRGFLVTMFGTWWSGGVFMPLNFRLAAAEISALVERGGPRVIVVEPGHASVLEEVEGLEDITVLLIDDDAAVPPTGAEPASWERVSTGMASFDVAEHETPEPLRRSMDDLGILMFTSGTTGLPKGVMLSFGNIFWNSINVDTLVDTRPGDMNYAAAPLFHIGALNSFTIRAFVRGNATVVRRAVTPEQALLDIEKYRVNSAFLVPAQLVAMAKSPVFNDADMSSLRATICAGAPVPPALIQEYAAKGMAVQQAWGLTETSPFATYLPARMTGVKAGSCGEPMPYTEIKLVDVATGEDITDPHVPGEMCVRGPNVTIGYWNDEEATAAAFPDGWFRSGDIGYRDEDGFYFIVDRRKDMVISGGENIYPAEVERALHRMPGVRDVAIVGAPDPKWGETVVAVIEFAAGAEADLDAVRAFGETQLARYKLPRELWAVDAVPRNAAGKIDKQAVRALVQARRQEAA
ncbi:fatty-acyl-CoA synthase [Raineyella antarctica]|uniref:Fatty-acyl-CoA synthase n=1 Tax=Raineyella antarctica TaxID=1577474 RepID=A0A1G6GF37_9ACTN|nr:AMP-binding protein [Raineyella antarctica]SDB80584.1 fatty-acyl-CoA synthase [Raineyella antarctica]